MIRNLACHIFPHRNGKWRRTVSHLLQRRDMFNGRRIFTVSTDDSTDDFEVVRESLADFDAEFLQFPNCPLQEARTFFPALDLLANTNPDELTFRCHAKGATHADNSAMSHLWCDAMFAACCDFPELMESQLKDATITGAFRSFGLWPFPRMHAWHYAGSFYWIRHNRAFNRDWRFLMPTLWGPEGWPGIFPRSESACLFHDDDPHATAHLYNPDHWRRYIVPEFDLWREEMQKRFGRDCWLPPDTKIPTEQFDLSIITSTWKRPSQLASVLQAFRQQVGGHHVEHIVVSDGPDQTAKSLCEKFEARYVELPANRGGWGCFAKDAGLKVARGRYVAFWDDDNTFYPDAIETLLSAAEGADVGIAQEDHLTGAGFATIPAEWTGQPVGARIDAMCFVVRRDLARLEKWADFPVYETDFHWIRRICKRTQSIRFVPKSVGMHI